MDKDLGLICSLTGRIADFNPTCPDFSEDAEAVARQESVVHSANDVSIRIPDKAYFRLEQEQNLGLGIAAGVAAGIVGAILWAIITVATKFQIGFMAVGIGIMVGFAVRLAGKGIYQSFGIAAAIIALLSCLFGNLFSMIGLIADYEQMTYFDVLLNLNFAYIPELMFADFSIIDILFYVLAISAGYKYAFREITEEEIARMYDNEH